MFEQTKLTYNYNGLEPVIDALTVETHYAKHHAAYAKNFNDAAEKAGVAEMDVEELLASLDKIEDPALRKALRNNGGGFYNHNLYFDTLAGPAEAAKAPEGKLLAQICVLSIKIPQNRKVNSPLSEWEFPIFRK